nr:S-layer homology domain-containing protein [Clostridia bacterium]
RFLDVPESAWFFSYVDGLAERGLMEGEAALFHPNEPSTRGEIVEILWKLAGSPEAGACPFTDVAAGSPYARAAAWAYEHGVAAGMGDGRFAPESPVTREQLAALLRAYVIALGKEDLLNSSAELTAFLDATDISSWAKDYVSWIVGLGLIGGTASGYLLPRGETTRAQLAVIITQYCSKIEE